MPDAPEKNSGGMGANQLAGSVIAGVGLGWLAQHFFPAIKPFGYVVGVILGFASGLWQVLKGEGALAKYRPKEKRGKSDQP